MVDIENIYKAQGAQKLIAIDKETGEIAGCVAYRTFEWGIAEMKRLYVVPVYRNKALGRRLAESIIALACAAGYKTMVLDTMIRMTAARQMYTSMGFKVVPPYNDQDTSKVICYKKEFSG